MPGELLTSRELFRSYATSLACPVEGLTGKPFNRKKPAKNWVDEFLYRKPSFIGKTNIKSPQVYEVQVNYGKNFVIYPYAVQVINGEYRVEELIISREDALLFNMPRGDEGTAGPDKEIPDFTDIPWDRPLADSEVITRDSPVGGWKIYHRDELTPVENQTLLTCLTRIESKIDRLLSVSY